MYILMAIPFIIILRLIKPLLFICFGPVRSDVIGHFAFNTELFLCECDNGLWYGKRTLKLFYFKTLDVPNQQLKTMWQRAMIITSFAARLQEANDFLPGGQDHTIKMPSSDRDLNNVLSARDPHISFTGEEEERGRQSLRELGIDDTDRFVCFLARDSAYKREMQPRPSSSGWDYHNYRDSDIKNYVDAVEALTKYDRYAIRLGAAVKETLEMNNPKIIDYATNGMRSDFLDIYLSGNCEFYIGDSCGIAQVVEVFRRPVALANYVPLEFIRTWNSQDIFIPKKHWLMEEKRFMTFREIFDSGAGRFLKTHQYEEMGIELIENTPHEIRDLALEMYGRIAGTWESTEEDENLQEKFWTVFPKSELHGRIQSKIGTAFLKENVELLI